ncbi:MAG: hypothetical protein R3E77_01155 [Steroidobacteraceae bacterium]
MEAATRKTEQPDVEVAAPAAGAMDPGFIRDNQIVERYLGGRLPPRGVSDFERFCRDNPDLLDAIGLPERVNKGLRLLEQGGKPEPWQQPQIKSWQKLPVLLAMAGLALVLAIVAIVQTTRVDSRDARILALQQQVIEQPLLPATRKRTMLLIPSRTGPGSHAAASIGSPEGAELADFKIDVSWSKAALFRITVDRVDQGRVMVLHNVRKDSNGHLRLGLNSSALGPGRYNFTIEALDWKGQAHPAAWISIAIRG